MILLPFTTLTIMSYHKKSHQHNNNNHHGLQQLAVGLQPLNLNLPDTPPVFTFTVMDYSSPEKPTDVTPTQVTNWYMRTDIEMFLGVSKCSSWFRYWWEQETCFYIPRSPFQLLDSAFRNILIRRGTIHPIVLFSLLLAALCVCKFMTGQIYKNMTVMSGQIKDKAKLYAWAKITLDKNNPSYSKYFAWEYVPYYLFST